MNFLTLCQRLRSLGGISGTGPVEVTNQTGEYERVVNWVADAWIKIQSEREGKWSFLISDFSQDTVASTPEYEFYSAKDVRSFDVDSMHIYLKSAGANTRRKLHYMEYKKFRNKFLDTSVTNYPSHFTVTPDNKLALYPVPDAVYTVVGDAYAKPVTLAANTDIPAMVEDLHMMIVYRALMDYGGYEETDAAYKHAQTEYARLYNQLVWMYIDEPEDMVVRPQ